MSRRYAARAALLALALVAAFSCSASAAQVTIQPSPAEARTFATTNGGWSSAVDYNGLVCIPGVTCPTANPTYQTTGGAGGAGDGYLRDSFGTLLGVLSTTTINWSSPSFVASTADTATLSVDVRPQIASLLAIGSVETRHDARRRRRRHENESDRLRPADGGLRQLQHRPGDRAARHDRQRPHLQNPARRGADDERLGRHLRQRRPRQRRPRDWSTSSRRPASPRPSRAPAPRASTAPSTRPGSSPRSPSTTASPPATAPPRAPSPSTAAARSPSPSRSPVSPAARPTTTASRPRTPTARSRPPTRPSSRRRRPAIRPRS